MEQHASPDSPPAAPAPVPPLHPRTDAAVPPDRTHWTPARQRIFLSCLLETGSVARAARAAGMSRSSAHRLRCRLAGTPFDRAWDEALRYHARRLADPFASDAALAASVRRVDAPGRGPSAASPERR